MVLEALWTLLKHYTGGPSGMPRLLWRPAGNNWTFPILFLNTFQDLFSTDRTFPRRHPRVIYIQYMHTGFPISNIYCKIIIPFTQYASKIKSLFCYAGFSLAG
jgi:hypothetical protein